MVKRRSIKRFRSILSFLLVFILLFNVISLDSYALPNQELGNGMMTIDKNEKSKPKNRFPKAKDEPVELKTKRDSNVKEFVNPDGSFTLEISEKPVHYKDNRGHWKEIDNTLIQSEKSGYQYENKDNAFKARFAENNELNPLVDFSLDENHWITFSPIGKFNAKGVVNNSTIEYKNFQPGMDLRYILDSDKLKEEIILSKNPKTNTFEFDLEYEGFIFEKDEEGIIWAKSDTTGEIEFYFQKSFAEDANGDMTFDADLSIIEEQGKEKLVLTVNNEWLENAVYPVIIDPTIETNMNENGVDTYISSDNPTSNYYLSSYLHAGNLSGYGTLRSLIRFKYLPVLAPGANITKAYLAAHMYLGSTNNTTIDVHEITSSWNSNEATWTEKPQFDVTPVLSNYTSTPNTIWEFDITPVVDKWYKGESPNYGVTLLASDEQSSKISFFSTDAAGQVNPKLVIEYEIDPLGLESYYGFDGNVNVHNGNLVLGTTDVTLPGKGMPIVVSRTYNSRVIESGIVGDRWRLNVGMKLDYASDKSSVLFTDGDGTVKYFVKEDEDGNYTSPIGTKMTLKEDAQANFYLEELSGIKYYFDSSGRLDYIEDTNNNITDLVYSDTTGELIQIIDPSSRQINFNYLNDKLDTITGNEIPTIKYNYNGDYLTSVEKKDGTTVLAKMNYGYDAYGNIYTITDNENNTTTIYYSWTAETGLKVDRVEKKLTIDGIQETLATTYNYAETVNGDGIITTVTNPKGDITKYTTNKMGNVINVVADNNGKNLTYQYDWDQQHNLIEVINPKGYDTVLNYTDNDELGEIINPKNERTIYKYDENNSDLIGITDSSGRPTTNNYDPTTRNVMGTINSAFATTVFDYDDAGNVTMVTDPIGIGENPVANGNFETWGGGLANRWDPAQGSGGTIIADSSIKVNGNYSAKLESTGSAYNQQAVLVSDYIEINPSTKYNVSWYVKNSSVDSTNATVEVHWYNSAKELLSGQSAYNLAPTKGTQDWQRKGARVNSPLTTGGSNDAAFAKIYLLVDDIGTAWFDNVQFEKGEAINNHNLLINESFEVDNDLTDVTPDNWDPATLTSIDDVTTDEAHTGEKSILINGDTFNRHFSQAFDIEGKEGTSLHFSGWSKSIGVSPSGDYYQVLLMIDYKNGEVDWIEADFSKNDHDWEYADNVAVAKYDFDRVLVYGKLENQPESKVWFDDFNVKLNGAANAVVSPFNLAENSSFEYDRDFTSWPDGWPKNAPGNENNIVWYESTDNEFAYNGYRMIKIYDVSGSAVVSTIKPEPIKDGQIYTASAVFKTDNVTGSGAILKFEILDAAGVKLAEKVSEPITEATYWTRVVLSLSEADAKALHQDAAQLKVSVGTEGAMNGSIFIDHVRFNEGSKETNYSYDSNQNYVESVTNQLGNTIDFINDNRGNAETITDPKGRSTSFTYDKLDRVKTTTNPEGLITRFIYNDNGTLEQIDNEINSVYYNTALYQEYNELGLVKSITDGSLVNTTYFEYDKNANLTDIDYPNGKGMVFSYDTANRLTDINYSVSGTHFNYQHDNNGNVTNVFKDAVQTTVNQYDELDRLTRKDFSQVGTYVGYDFNQSSQIKKIENSIVATKDSDSLILFDYDQAGYPVEIDGPNGTYAAFMYDEEGKIKKSYLKGSGTHYLNYRTYNDIGQIVGYRVETASGDVVLDYRYEYDVNGNRTKEIDVVSKTRTEYDYDELNQVDVVKYYDTAPDPDILIKTMDYDYDKLGNRTLSSEQGGVTNSFEYDQATNKITKLNGQSLYVHDANGNLTQSDNWQYTYNDAGQLIQATDGVTNVIYEYNSNGLRTKKEIVNEGKIELYYYNGTKLAYITDGSHQLKYFFLRDVTGRPINMIDYTAATPQTYWYLYNAHGDVVGLADNNGDKVATYEYDVWGNILNASSTVNTGDNVALWQANPFRYSGYQYDDETGLYYLKSRYYSPFLGRFITRDAIVALNLYAYASNNPINFIDPNGYYSVLDTEGNIVLTRSGDIVDQRTGDIQGNHGPNIIQKAAHNVVISVADDFRENTVSNTVGAIMMAFGGAQAARAEAQSGFTMRERYVNWNTLKGGTKGGAVGLIKGNAATRIINMFTDIEGSFDRTPLGKQIDDWVTAAEDWLHEKIGGGYYRGMDTSWF